MSKYEEIPDNDLTHYCYSCEYPINGGNGAMEHHSNTGHFRFYRGALTKTQKNRILNAPTGEEAYGIRQAIWLEAKIKNKANAEKIFEESGGVYIDGINKEKTKKMGKKQEEIGERRKHANINKTSTI